MEIIYLSYILSFVFLLLAVIVYKGYKFECKIKDSSNSTSELSIVIAAKNEEKNINSLIDSLEKLNYPNENFEIIIVDDNSTDKTAELIESRITNKNNFVLIKADKKEMEGKKGALSIGIKNVKNNFIVITDADCKPETNWLAAMAGGLDYGYDFVFGVAPIKTGGKIVEKLSAFENLQNTYLTIAAVGLNIPYSAAARSFAFRKTSFERIGGYSNTTETLSGDDDLLLREAVKNKMLIGTVIEPDAFVYSAAPKTFNEYFQQKKRHLQTSFHYLLKQKIFLGFWHLINLLSLLSVLLIFISPVLALPFAVKLIHDVFVVIKYQQRLGHSFKFYEILYLQFLFEVFVVVNFFNSLSGNTKWK
jgi:cellulose synthase/poly-beta-1,6-N-acetylglucosamine synthase-like glycosyltransferase